MFAEKLDIEDKEKEENMNECDKTVFSNTRTKKVILDLNSICENKVLSKEQKLCEKMFVEVKNNSQEILFGRIEFLYKTDHKDMAHILLFMHSRDTLLGTVADSQEIVALKKCTNIDINNVVKVLDVVQKIPSDDWFSLGGSKLENLLDPVNRNNKDSFFYQMQYDDKFGRFEYPKAEDPCNVKKDKYCSNCEEDELERKSQIPELLKFIEKENYISYFYEVKIYNEKYKVGNFIYLEPEIFSLASRLNFSDEKSFVHTENNTNNSNQLPSQLLKDIDETMFPEYYRKTLENTMRGSNESTPNPFEIAEILMICSIDGDKENVRLDVRRMYRAEQIPLEDYDKKADMNMLLWSDEQFRIPCKSIIGKCYVAYIANIPDPLVWSAGGPDRFYFKNKYDFLTGTIIPDEELTSHAKMIGQEVFFNYNYKHVTNEDIIQYIPSYKKIRPLNCLNIFAGCGGLSKGLEDSGLIISKWAMESDKKAAVAFKLNHPESTVFVEDCNYLLDFAMSGDKINSKNQKIPQKGEVDFICGNPCQELSGVEWICPEQYQYSLIKKNLIYFLSLIDFYRPKFFVMEYNRDFVSILKNMALKLTFKCITKIGYQCSFGILQAGNFGVPQDKTRLFIMAAAPGEQLPLYPEPTHVFSRRDSTLSDQIGDFTFLTNCKYGKSAPMRTVTVYDAWSDLPKISNGASVEKIAYNSEPITYLQKLLRCSGNQSPQSIVTDHICKTMFPLMQARIELIPIGEGCDWRDLPNIVVKLSDGTFTNKLKYSHHDSKNGKSKNGALRGVCQCATTGKKCDPQDVQKNTIIPWCLPHFGNKHNNCAGVLGRLDWKGFCSTITDPEPKKNQGRVLHPEQHRVVSVRECARSQGFTDSYLFYGPLINKHGQIGKAVPPPMGKAIGHEIIKAIDKNSKSSCS